MWNWLAQMSTSHRGSFVPNLHVIYRIPTNLTSIFCTIVYDCSICWYVWLVVKKTCHLCSFIWLYICQICLITINLWSNRSLSPSKINSPLIVTKPIRFKILETGPVKTYLSQSLRWNQNCNLQQKNGEKRKPQWI